MQAENLWWSYLYFHLPNYALALLFWTLIGRFMFALFLPPDSPNYIFRWFRRLTDWFLVPVAAVAPRILPAFLLPPIAAFCVVVLRVAFFLAMYAAGLTPRAAPA